MEEKCVPYPRKGLYWLLTIPLLFVYVLIAAYLWTVGIGFFILYCLLFVFVSFFMSYVCVYWECSYVGKFAPCVGGFCLPSSQIARLWKKTKRSKRIYNLTLNLAYLSFFGIILFPVYFLFLSGFFYLLAYMGIVIIYTVLFMLLICPVCATRHVCPGGQSATALQAYINRKRDHQK